MSLHYLLDGYNIIHQVPRWAKASLEDGRRELIGWIAAASPQGSGRNSITVVFDGQSEHFAGASSAGARVVFTKGESADDYIKRKVETAAQKKHYVVVTDDKDIKLYVRALGAAVMGVREFAAEFFRSPAKASRASGRGPGEKGKYVSLAQAQKINQEMEKIWLKGGP